MLSRSFLTCSVGWWLLSRVSRSDVVSDCKDSPAFHILRGFSEHCIGSVVSQSIHNKFGNRFMPRCASRRQTSRYVPSTTRLAGWLAGWLADWPTHRLFVFPFVCVSVFQIYVQAGEHSDWPIKRIQIRGFTLSLVSIDCSQRCAVLMLSMPSRHSFAHCVPYTVVTSTMLARYLAPRIQARNIPCRVYSPGWTWKGNKMQTKIYILACSGVSFAVLS